MKRYIESAIVPVFTLNDWIAQNRVTGPKYPYIYVLCQDDDITLDFVLFAGDYDRLCVGIDFNAGSIFDDINYSDISDVYENFEVVKEVTYDDGGIALLVYCLEPII